MKILITGGAGFLGSHLCEKYVKEGHTVFVIDNLTNGNLNNLRNIIHKRNFKFINGDIRNESVFSSLPSDINAIINLAAQIHTDRSVINPRETFENNVNGTQNVLEFARITDVQKIIHASTSEIYGSAQYVPMDENHPLGAKHPYGVSKIAADRLCYTYNETYGMGINIVRSFNIYGPRQQDTGYGGVIAIFIKRVLQNKPPIIYGDGSQTRDYMFIKDAITALDLILQSRQNPGVDGINFGTGVEISVKEIAQKIIKLGDKEGILRPVFTDPRHVEVPRLIADISKATKNLGFKPKFSFDEGLAETVEWYRDYKSEMWVY